VRTAVTYHVTCTVAECTFVAGHCLEHYERYDEKGTPTYYRGTPNVSASAVKQHFCGCKLQASCVSVQVVCSETDKAMDAEVWENWSDIESEDESESSEDDSTSSSSSCEEETESGAWKEVTGLHG